MNPGPDELARVRAVIFDVDGVLLDARPSYHAVAEEAARRAVALVVGEADARAIPFDAAVEVPLFKAAGHFNDDWEMARAMALLLLLRCRVPRLRETALLLDEAGGEGVAGFYRAHAGKVLPALPLEQARHFLDASWFARTCGALYGGNRCQSLFGFDAREVIPDAPEVGWWTRETPLVDRAVLAAVQTRFPLGLFTGRNPGEAALAIELLGLAIPLSRTWVADGRPRKPDPTGLQRLCADLLAPEPFGLALFLGDTADDLAAANRARAAGAALTYAHVEGTGDTQRVLRGLLDATPPA